MTKRIARLALAVGAVAAFAAPAAPASAASAGCEPGTFLVQCLKDAVTPGVSQICVTTFVCLPSAST